MSSCGYGGSVRGPSSSTLEFVVESSTGPWRLQVNLVPVEGDGRTFAEMSADEKHRVSHRGRAFRTLADGLKVVEALEAEQ